MEGEKMSTERRGHGIVVENRGKQILENSVSDAGELPKSLMFEGKLFELSFRNMDQGNAVYHHQVSDAPFQAEGLAIDCSGAVLEHWENDGKDQERAVEALRVAREHRKTQHNA